MQTTVHAHTYTQATGTRENKENELCGNSG